MEYEIFRTTPLALLLTQEDLANAQCLPDGTTIIEVRSRTIPGEPEPQPPYRANLTLPDGTHAVGEVFDAEKSEVGEIVYKIKIVGD